jgi:hypothetical protein
MPGVGSLRVWQRRPSASTPRLISSNSVSGATWKRQPRATRVITLFELHREITKLGRKKSAAVFPLRQCQTGNLSEIVDLPVDVWRLECRVANPFDVDHGHSEASIALR